MKKIEKDKTNPQSKLKVYKKKKNIKNFTFQNQKIIDDSSLFLLIYFFLKFRILIFKCYFKFYNILKFINYHLNFII